MGRGRNGRAGSQIVIQGFQGWASVAERLRDVAEESPDRLNEGQCASLVAIANRIENNGVIIADEVGMGKTRIAVEVCRAVAASGGRVAVVVPTGLGFQWQEEFRQGGMDRPEIIRSLWGYLEAWKDSDEPRPWYRENIVILTHTFSNWRLSDKSGAWRWGMLPAIYAYWRRSQEGRFPRGFNKCGLDDDWLNHAAEDICAHIQAGGDECARMVVSDIEREYSWHTSPNGSDYIKNGRYRTLLHKAVGLGMGAFDLVVIDEAHKSRGGESGLSRILDEVVLPQTNARRLALTATPVELDVTQWLQILERISVREPETCRQAIDEYANAVRNVRVSWAGSEASRNAYYQASIKFQRALGDYLVRRDKRMDMSVQRFVEKTGESYDAYRREHEICITPEILPDSWRQAICAAESLSMVSDGSDEQGAKRLRLTMGSGHGIAAHLDRLTENGMDSDGDVESRQGRVKEDGKDSASLVSSKRQQRAMWWQSVLGHALAGSNGLYSHPGILAAVEEIEKYTRAGQKVLVFGRFTAPLKALTELLNARQLLQCLEEGEYLPQEKIHEGARDAIPFALEQLSMSYQLDEIDVLLETQYKQLEGRRRLLRKNLSELLEEAIKSGRFAGAANDTVNYKGEVFRHLVRAVDELIGGSMEPTPVHCREAFAELISALHDMDEEAANSSIDNEGDTSLPDVDWSTLAEMLSLEYGDQRGAFSRLMYGNTLHQTRRLMQMGFNRQVGYPKVLVCQSIVGREGLNLHQACRVVVLLHPEWNPGVVEQQIGRVDRVGSRWSKEFDEYVREGRDDADIPRIEIRPVIFEGTYDSYNWRVLRDRWDDLRAQLHGVVVPRRARESVSEEDLALIRELDSRGPDFSPKPIFDRKGLDR